MSDENLSRKLREASLLASKFFSDLAVIFDSKTDANHDFTKTSKKALHQSSSSIDPHHSKAL
jgi:hypothetical protein